MASIGIGIEDLILQVLVLVLNFGNCQVLVLVLTLGSSEVLVLVLVSEKWYCPCLIGIILKLFIVSKNVVLLTFLEGLLSWAEGALPKSQYALSSLKQTYKK